MNYNINELVYEYLFFDDQIKFAEYLNDTYLMKKTYQNKLSDNTLINDLLMKNLIEHQFDENENENENEKIIFGHCEYCNTIYDYNDIIYCECPLANHYLTDGMEHTKMCKKCTDSNINVEKYKCSNCKIENIIIFNCKGVYCYPPGCCNIIICHKCMNRGNVKCDCRKLIDRPKYRRLLYKLNNFTKNKKN
jgi:hypothetical protein